MGRKLMGIVFDLDGTLTNSIEVYHDVFIDIAARVGINMTRDQLFRPMAEGLDPWDRAFPKDDPNRAEKIQEYRRLSRPAFKESLKRVRPFSGIENVLALLHEKDLVMGLVTDSSKTSLETLHTHAISHYFSAMITRDDGIPRKPEPDGLLECLRRMEISPKNAVFIGDAIIDVQAGKKAGTLTIGVLTGLASRDQFEADPPTALVDDVTQIPSVLNL
jgi:HAD superfamily hydrolase (TIGR01509 family)